MPTVAYALGRLVLLFKAYEPESKAQSIKASRPRTNVTKAELVKFRTKFILDTGKARGWKPAASKNLNMDIKTLNKIWE
jgi:hypothetical protein